MAKMTEYLALQIVLDLANQNVLEDKQCDSKELKKEKIRQEQAMAIVENMAENLKTE